MLNIFRFRLGSLQKLKTDTNSLADLAAPTPLCPSQMPKSPNCQIISTQGYYFSMREVLNQKIHKLPAPKPDQPQVEAIDNSKHLPWEASLHLDVKPLDLKPNQIQREYGSQSEM